MAGRTTMLTDSPGWSWVTVATHETLRNSGIHRGPRDDLSWSATRQIRSRSIRRIPSEFPRRVLPGHSRIHSAHVRHVRAPIATRRHGPPRVQQRSARGRGFRSSRSCGAIRVAPNHAPTLSSDAISVISSYLNKVRCASSKIVLNDVLEVAQRDFVERRVRARHAGMTECGEHDLHRWLTMTALQAKSRGVLKATVDDWNQALLLDEAMRTIKI